MRALEIWPQNRPWVATAAEIERGHRDIPRPARGRYRAVANLVAPDDIETWRAVAWVVARGGIPIAKFATVSCADDIRGGFVLLVAGLEGEAKWIAEARKFMLGIAGMLEHARIRIYGRRAMMRLLPEFSSKFIEGDIWLFEKEIDNNSEYKAA